MLKPSNFLSTLPHSEIIFFDGVCNLCNSSVDFLVRNDSDKKYRYASLQSDIGQSLLFEIGKSTSDFDSFIYVSKGKIYLESGAAIRVLKGFGGIWTLVGTLLIIPPFIRNFIYSLIAKNRYKWFGKKETCRIPNPEERALFLD